MSNRRRIFANLGWLLGERLLRLAVNVAILGLVARHLGPEGFGAINYAAGLTTLFLALATLGLDAVVVRELVRTPGDAPTILGTAFALRLLGGLAAIAALALTAPLLIATAGAMRPLVMVMSLALLWQAFDVIDLWFQKDLLARHTVLAKLAALAAGSTVKLWLVAQGASLVWFCWAFVLDGVGYAMALAAVYRSQGGRFGTWRFAGSTARRLLQTAWPLVTSGLLVSLYLRLDQILVLRLLGPRELGFYTAAGKVAELWMTISAFVLTSAFPLLVARRERGSETFQRDLQFTFDAMTGLGYTIAVFVSLAAPVLVPLMFGETYRPAASVLSVLGWSAPFMCSGGMRGHFFMLEGTTTYHNWAALIGIAANLLLALALVPQLGGPGAALTVVLSSAASAWLSSFFFPRFRDCARLQTKALLLPFRPRAWAELVRRLQ